MTTKIKKLAQVYHYDLYGKRQEKYDFLNDNSIDTIEWNELENRKPEFFFVKKDWKIVNKYEKGFYVGDIFIYSSSGVQTEFDDFVIATNIDTIKHRINEIFSNDLQLYAEKNKLIYSKCKRSFNDLNNNNYQIINYAYKPFDNYYAIYTGKTNGIMGRPRHELTKNFIKKENVGYIFRRSATNITGWQHIFISNNVSDKNFLSAQTYNFPLYLYPNKSTDGVFAEEGLSEKGRKPNLNTDIVEQIAKKLKLKFVPEKDVKTHGRASQREVFAPIDILDYIYAVLHSPTYRDKYKEFLKIDFPRVPYPKNKKTFWKLVKFGSEIRKTHLLESPKVEEFITSYPIAGDNIITRKMTKNSIGYESTNKENGKVWINDQQYFDKVPLVAWEFYIGGYQPAQKWLKDRKKRKLKFEDILHYQKIIVALTETDRLMKKIDKIKI